MENQKKIRLNLRSSRIPCLVIKKDNKRDSIYFGNRVDNKAVTARPYILEEQKNSFKKLPYSTRSLNETFKRQRKFFSSFSFQGEKNIKCSKTMENFRNSSCDEKPTGDNLKQIETEADTDKLLLSPISVQETDSVSNSQLKTEKPPLLTIPSNELDIKLCGKSKQNLPNNSKTFPSEKRLLLKNIKEKATAANSRTQSNFKMNDSWKIRAIETESLPGDRKNALFHLIDDLPENWVGVAVKIAESRNKVVASLVEKISNEEEVHTFYTETDEIRKEIEIAKTFTQEKVLTIKAFLETLYENLSETKKLRKTQNLQNKKIMALNLKLETTQSMLKMSQTNANADKTEMEGKYKKLATEASNTKKSLLKQLREKSAVLQNSISEMTKLRQEVEGLRTSTEDNNDKNNQAFDQRKLNFISQGNTKLENDLKRGDMDDTENYTNDGKCQYSSEGITESSEPKLRTSKKEIKLLKSTIKKLEDTVQALSTQNAELRGMVTTSERQVALDADGRVVQTLTNIINDKQRDVERLMEIVRLMQQHWSAAHIQRTHLEARLAALKTQLQVSRL